MLQPPACGADPAGMRHDAARRLLQERCAASQQRRHRLATAGRVHREVRAPRVDGRRADLAPRPPIPGAEIEFIEARVKAVRPTPAREPAPDIGRALQGRGGHDPRRLMLPRPGAHAMRQPLGLAPIDTQIGAADAAPRRAAWLRVAPHRPAHWCTFVLRTPVFALGAARRAHVARAAASQPSSISNSVICCVAPSASPV